MAREHDEVKGTIARVFEFGPKYDLGSAKLSKWRTLARGRELTLDEQRRWGRDVLAAVHASNRAKLMREVAEPRTNCASGYPYGDAKGMFAAIRRQNRAKLLAPGTERTPAQWQHDYEEAMERCGK